MVSLRRDVIAMIHLYTGNGKGKTTAAFGLALRNAGWGGKVLIIQFLKSSRSGELNAVARIPEIEVRQFGTGRFLDKRSIEERDYKLARMGLEVAEETLSSGNYTLVVLDEINVAVHLGLLKEDDVLRVLGSKHTSTEVVMTGRYAPRSFYDVADYVTEFIEVKHPYRMGIQARKGIEY